MDVSISISDFDFYALTLTYSERLPLYPRPTIIL